MNKMIRSSLFTLFALSLTLALRAQDALDTDKVDMADTFRSNGKIYVVVAVLVTILLALILWVFSLDRKISRMEKGSKS